MKIVNHAYPVLNLPQLLNLPKGQKPQDMERILHSPSSEDWVTWNFFQVLFLQYKDDWWARLVSAARRRNPDFAFTVTEASVPTPHFWSRVPSPPEYEAQSRARMSASGNNEWQARAKVAEPVEGPSEIDLTFDHAEFLVHVEAKLGSDISMRTSYDPQRNQIVRNIDCLFARAGTRQPIFWLLARDDAPTRLYVQLMNDYKTDHSLLVSALPHRDSATLKVVAQNLTILLWRDFRDLVSGSEVDPEVSTVKRELERRIL